MSKNRQDDFPNHDDTMGEGGTTQMGNEFADHFDIASSADENPNPAPVREEVSAYEEDYGDEEDDGFDLASATSEYELLENADDLLSTDEPDVTQSLVTAAVKRRRNLGRQRSTHPAPSGSVMVFIGGLMMTVGFGLAITAVVAPSKIQPAIDNLNTMGLTPGLMVTLGVVLALVSQLTSRLHGFQLRMAEFAEFTRYSNETVTENLEFLVDSQEQSDSRRPASGEELDQVLMGLTRQDEKISNLTKALKMYGKPLVEVSRHVAEVAARAKSNTTDLRSLKETVQTSIDAATHKIIDNLTSIVAEIPADNGVGQLTESLNKFGEQLRTDLPGLVGSSGTDATVFAEEARALGNQLTKEFSEMLDRQGKHSDSGDVASLRKDIEAMQTAIRGLTSALEHNPGSPGPTATNQPSPAPTPEPVAAPAASESTPHGPGVLAQSISGSTKSKGKNVLGAIAKLKKMRP